MVHRGATWSIFGLHNDGGQRGHHLLFCEILKIFEVERDSFLHDFWLFDGPGASHFHRLGFSFGYVFLLGFFLLTLFGAPNVFQNLRNRILIFG